MDEQFYIDCLHKGDEKIFRGIFEKYHARLYYFAVSLLTADQSAEDAVQEAFVKLWQKKEQFHDLNAVKSFLYIAVKNRCLNISKHNKIVRKYSGLLPPGDAGEDGMDYIIEAEVLENIHQALQQLPAGCRNVLQLSYFEEMKNKDIADHLQVSINTVKTQKKRALHLLRAILKTSPCWFFPLLKHLF